MLKIKSKGRNKKSLRAFSSWKCESLNSISTETFLGYISLPVVDRVQRWIIFPGSWTAMGKENRNSAVVISFLLPESSFLQGAVQLSEVAT